MRRTSYTLLALAAWCVLSVAAIGREWTDSTGNYKVEATFVAANDTTVVLKKDNHELVAVPIDKLSKADQQYLQSKEATDSARRSADQLQTWTMASGMKIVGRVVNYGRKDVTIQRRRAKIYVNDRLLDNLPEIYQQLVPKIVSHYENTPIDGRKGLEQWVLKLKADPRTYAVDGVVMELENGDEYGIPLFLFSDEALKIISPGFDRWAAAAQDKARRDQEAFLLQSEAQAYQQDQKANQQIQMMQLQMQGYQAGLFDLWQVCMTPRTANNGAPMCVVVPARNSRDASDEALRRNPGYILSGPIAKVSRLNYSP